MKHVTGYVEMSQQLFDQTYATHRAWAELEWIATHYEEATPEQRARLDAWEPDWDALEEMYDDR